MLKSLWLDEGGAILSAELCLIMVLLVIGMVVGLTALRDAVDAQLADIAGAIAAIDPGYAFSGLGYSSLRTSDGNTMGWAYVHGSAYTASVVKVSGVDSVKGILKTITTSKDTVGAMAGS